MLMIKRMFKISITILILFLFSSCSSKFYYKELTKQNLTYYVFNKNIKDVNTAMRNVFIDFNMNFSATFFEENFYKKYFIDSNNIYDMYLFVPNTYIQSEIYFNKNNNKGLDYYVKYFIHLDEIDTNKTKVTVNTISSQILIGSKFGFAHNFRLRVANLINVERETIQEYRILLAIGDALNEEDMPSIILPNKNKHNFKVKKGKIVLR